MNKEIMLAHISNTGEEQTLIEHSENTARLCADFAIEELKEQAYLIGLFHDLGKYSDAFQERIRGKNIKVEHSISGAIEIEKCFTAREDKAFNLIAQYCIAGHHSGIPDGGFKNDTKDERTLSGRLKREAEPYEAYKKEINIPEINNKKFCEYLMKDCDRNEQILYDKFAFFVRYLFSCLVDADSLDTANFMNNINNTPLVYDFEEALRRVKDKLNSFKYETELQKARGRIQNQVFLKENVDSEIYLLNMPTGSGKTLCSVKYALEKAIKHRKKRIIYVIPYNSIIDQTAEQFEGVFGDCVSIVRHQSTFLYEEDDELYDTKKCALENWDAPFIITTAVQFFGSIYDNKRGKLRKVHNMADSILVFDEAHLMPIKYLQPCLQSIAFITKYLNSEALFLTATMPDFKDLITREALSNSKIYELINDTSDFSFFEKCKFKYIDTVSDEFIIKEAAKYDVSLIIVNTRKKARQLYEKAGEKKYHLSTYMTPYDRKRILSEIKTEISKRNEKITIISTSLIEAGVDLDADVVFRELNGLDSILQAGGRCNREGKLDNACTYIFEFDDNIKSNAASNITKGIINDYENISSDESIKHYFEEIFKYNNENISQNAIHNREDKHFETIPFREYAEEFRFIDSNSKSIFVESDEESKKLLSAIKYSDGVSERKLQMYVCNVYENELDDLIKQHVVENYNGVWVLTNSDYYDNNIGITFDAKDYFI